jgi:hypothetical protein
MKALPVPGVPWCTRLPAGHAQALSVADWQGLLAAGVRV